MEIFIENERVKFTQGVQTFAIDYEGNQEELEWMVSQLDAAFRNFMHEIKIETIKEYTEKSIQYLIKGGKEKPDSTSENGLHKHVVMQRSELFCECSTDHGRYFDALTTTMRCNHCELRAK